VFLGGREGILKKVPKSVLFVTYHFPPEVGGIQTRIYQYIKNLKMKGVKVSVIVVSSSKKMRKIVIPDTNITYLNGEMKHYISNIFRVTRQIKRNKTQVVHIYTGSSTIFCASILIIARLMLLRTSASIFGREDVTAGSVFRRLISIFSLGICSSVSANSNATRKLLPPSLASKTHILYGGAEIRMNGSSDNFPRILFVGRLVERKGVDDLIRAFATVKKRHRDAKLIIVGEGTIKEKLLKLCDKLGVSSDVEFKGELEGNSLSHEYETCTVCVLPSKNVCNDISSEGLGLALIEAAAHGKPLVGTDHGGIPEIIENGKNGIIVRQGDWSQLSDAIIYILENKEEAERLGRNAIEKAANLFTWEKVTERLLESYCS
jgi:glycosyltransferase involved in cell wall biosynthesis